MNIGYFFHGHLGDKLTYPAVDTPDGNAFYSYSIIHQLIKDGNDVYGMGVDQDKTCYLTYGDKIFDSFDSEVRKFVYQKLKFVKWQEFTGSWGIKEDDLPELDFLLLEWRFPIPGRNTFDDWQGKTPGFQPDLFIQNFLIKEYSNRGVPIIIMDLDYKLNSSDETTLLENYGDKFTILETAKLTKGGNISRISVDIPFRVKETFPFNSVIKDFKRKICYVGSRYERDESIEKYIIPISQKYPYEVLFYGNWKKHLNYIMTELKWYYIQYHYRIGHSKFKEAYAPSICCPLLAKNEYYKNGFMTARILESTYFGCIPIGFSEHYGITDYLPKKYIVSSYKGLETCIKSICEYTPSEYYRELVSIWNNLSFMDVSNFVNTLYKVYGDLC